MATLLCGLTFAPLRAAAEPVRERAPPLARALLAWGNDQLYAGSGDDVGFTQDLSLELHALELLAEHSDLSLASRQRLIVERYGPRRTDEMTFDLRWLLERPWGPLSWVFGPTLGLALSGNYGGAKLQDAWHRTLDNGYTLGSGLPNGYGPHRTGVVIGARGGPSWLATPWLRVLVGGELQGAVGGTGRSLVALYDAVEVEPRNHGLRFAVSSGVDFERTWTRDPGLKLPGGYATGGFEKSAHLRVAARADQWEFGTMARTNVGGAGTHQGVIYLLVGGGDAFRHGHAIR